MKRLMCLLLMGSIYAQTIPQTLPQEKKPFVLTYYDFKENIYDYSTVSGRIIVNFFINELGQVEDPIIMDTFNIDLNAVVLDKLRQTSYHPATPNGKPVKVKYSLPIVFN